MLITVETMTLVLKAIHLTSGLMFSAGCFQPHMLLFKSCVHDEPVSAHQALALLHVAEQQIHLMSTLFMLRRNQAVEDLEVRLNDYWLLGECVGPTRSCSQ